MNVVEYIDATYGWHPGDVEIIDERNRGLILTASDDHWREQPRDLGGEHGGQWVKSPEAVVEAVVEATKKLVSATIYRKHAHDTVVATSQDGRRRMRWDAPRRKFIVEDRKDGGNGVWTEVEVLGKGQAYEQVKKPDKWFEPGQVGTKIAAPRPPQMSEKPPTVVEPTAKPSRKITSKLAKTPHVTSVHQLTDALKPQLRELSRVSAGQTGRKSKYVDGDADALAGYASVRAALSVRQLMPRYLALSASRHGGVPQEAYTPDELNSKTTRYLETQVSGDVYEHDKATGRRRWLTRIDPASVLALDNSPVELAHDRRDPDAGQTDWHDLPGSGPTSTPTVTTHAAVSDLLAEPGGFNEVERAFKKARAENAFGDGTGGAPLRYLAELRGADSSPRVGTDAELDAEVARGGTELWRAVRPSADGRTADELMRDLRDGDASKLYWGYGVYGNGIYAGNDRQVAVDYGTPKSGGTKGPGALVRVVLAPDARVADWKTLDAEYRTWADDDPRRQTIDPGAYAMARGYDAIRTRESENFGLPGDDSDHYTLLDRGKLLMSDTIDEVTIGESGTVQTSRPGAGSTPGVAERALPGDQSGAAGEHVGEHAAGGPGAGGGDRATIATASYVGPRFEVPDDVPQSTIDELRKLERKRMFHVYVADEPDLTSEESSRRYLLGDPLIRQHRTLLNRISREAEVDASFEMFRRVSDVDQSVTDHELQRELAAKTREAFADKKIAVRVTPGELDKILGDGRFKSQFETNMSKGHKDTNIRAQFEAEWFGLDVDGTPSSKRPIYGYVALDGVRPVGVGTKDLFGVSTDALSQYGTVQVILRDEVRRRTTAMFGDSLSNHHQGMPSPVDDPDWRSFTPVGTRSMVTPGLDTSDRDPGSQRFRASNYAEAEIHGGVTLADVEEVVFPITPPAALRMKLDDADVSWRVLNLQTAAQGSPEERATALRIAEQDSAYLAAEVADTERKIGEYRARNDTYSVEQNEKGLAKLRTQLKKVDAALPRLRAATQESSPIASKKTAKKAAPTVAPTPPGTGELAGLDPVKRGARVERILDDKMRRKLSTAATHTAGWDVWTPERDKIHREIANELYARAADVPSEGRALLLGGLIGAGKTTVLRDHAGIDPARYLVISPDDVKEELARRGLVPEVPGHPDLSPMERSALVHQESLRISRMLIDRALRDRKNVIWDGTMGNPENVVRNLNALETAGYDRIDAVFVDIPIELSARRAAERYARGVANYERGEGQGGRYVPRSVIDSFRYGGTTLSRDTFDRLRDRFDSWELWDNSQDGQPPRMLTSHGIIGESSSDTIRDARIAKLQKRLVEIETEAAPIRDEHARYLQKKNPTDNEDITDQRGTARLHKLGQEASDQASELLDLLVERDGAPWGGDPEYDAARWTSASSLHGMPTAGRDGVDLTKVAGIRDRYVVNDRNTVTQNASLRSDRPSAAATAWAKRMRRWIRSSETQRDLRLYRGAALRPDQVMRLRPGDVIHDLGVMSTGETLDTASTYAGIRAGRMPGTVKTLFEIRVPKGTSAVRAGYDEIVLDHGNDLRVISSRIDGDGVVHVILELIGNS